MNMKMKKSEMINKLEALKIPYEASMTKAELMQQYEEQAPLAATEGRYEEAVQVLSSAVAEIKESVENEEIPTEEDQEPSMAVAYKEFCTFDMNLFTQQFGEFNFQINGLKKTIFVKIDPDQNYAYVFTILNKKLSNDSEENKRNARNILTLKSLKALKSYTITQSK
jgi:hypothetical protein